MGIFKEKQIEVKDAQIHELEVLQRSYHEEDLQDDHTLYFPKFEKEVGGLLPHERRFVSIDALIDILRKN